METIIHRSRLPPTLDDISNKISTLQDQVKQRSKDSNFTPFSDLIRNWETKTIEKVRSEAENARIRARECNITLLQRDVNTLSEHVTELRKTGQYSEGDLNKIETEISRLNDSNIERVKINLPVLNCSDFVVPCRSDLAAEKYTRDLCQGRTPTRCIRTRLRGSLYVSKKQIFNLDKSIVNTLEIDTSIFKSQVISLKVKVDYCTWSTYLERFVLLSDKIILTTNGRQTETSISLNDTIQGICVWHEEIAVIVKDWILIFKMHKYLSKWQKMCDWGPPLSCMEDETICTIGMNKEYFLLVLTGKTDDNVQKRLELRTKSMFILTAVPFSGSSPKIYPLLHNHWLLVRETIIRVDQNLKIWEENCLNSLQLTDFTVICDDERMAIVVTLDDSSQRLTREATTEIYIYSAKRLELIPESTLDAGNSQSNDEKKPGDTGLSTLARSNKSKTKTRRGFSKLFCFRK